MTKSLLISIQPQHLLNILNGLKTIEVRKRDLPQWAKDKLARGEKVIGYGYCTKGKPYLYDFTSTSMMEQKYEIANVLLESQRHLILNGRVVVKFEVSGTTRYVDCSDCTNTENGHECENDFMYLLSVDPTLRKSTCLTADEIEEYGNGADIYAHHIKNVQPVNMELREFEVWYGGEESFYPLKRASQSFQTVWVKGE